MVKHQKTFTSHPIRSFFTELTLGFVAALLLFATALTPAVFAADFDPGNIISDAVMSDYTSMSVAEIQKFLTEKNPCNNTDYELYQEQTTTYPNLTWHWTGTKRRGHFVCLSEERFGDGVRYGDTLDPDLDGEGQTAAEIIAAAAAEYQINPRVLLVLLEKEQGLISDDFPHSNQYRSATGYGCPDTSTCDSKYYGFKNQIEQAAYLFRYTLDHGSTTYPINRSVYIAYNPSTSCGGSVIKIKNRATAALYRYTPYQPNSAAIAAGFGTGDTCSSYGNRNFWLLYNKWFGNPAATAGELSAAEQIPTVYSKLTSAGVKLGTTIGGVLSNDETGIYYQQYQNGYIVGNDTYGYYESRGKIREYWAKTGYEYGIFGFPTSNILTNSETGISYQIYQGGQIVGTDKTGYYESRGKIREYWAKTGYEYGELGLPLSNILTKDGVSYQKYQGGTIFADDTKTWHTLTEQN